MRITSKTREELCKLKVRETESLESVVCRLMRENKFSEQMLKREFTDPQTLKSLAQMIAGRMKKDYNITEK